LSTTAAVPHLEPSGSLKKLGIAWVALALALAVHVIDEALTAFLAVHNPTVLAMRAQFGFWPMPTFGFREWLGGLVTGLIVLLALSPFVFRGASWIRPIFYVVATSAGVLNALGHTLGTILGQTVSTVRFARPAPGLRRTCSVSR
jgi:hypothetical protein